MAIIDKIKLSDTTYDIASPVGYGICSTDVGIAAKVVTISNTDWVLQVGSIIGVRFTKTNTASSVTLNVNSTGAKNIWYNDAKYTGSSSSICGYANRIIYYMYDGTYWVWLNMGSLDGNSDTKVTQTVRTTNGEFPILLRGTSAGTTTTTTTTTFASAVKVNPSTGIITAGGTPAAGDNSTKVATTAFVQAAISNAASAPIVSTTDIVAGETALASGQFYAFI
jgi:hypothetical protein